MLKRSVSMLAVLVIAASWTGMAPIHAAESKSKPKLAVFTFGGQITESPMGDSFPFSVSGESFNSLITRLKKTKQDDSVKAVVLMVSGTSLGTSQIEEVRQVLDDIRASGKDVVAHADSITTKSYLLLSGASKLVVVPTGDIRITGIYGESPYMRGLLDIMGIKPDYTTCGDYKSAGEMFMLHGPSKKAKANHDRLFDGIFDTYLQLIASGRKVDVATARKWIDQGLYTAAGAKKAGIIDEIKFRQDFEAELKAKYGDTITFDKKFAKKKSMNIDFSSPFGILKFYGELLTGPKKPKPSKASVAIVYVEGLILPGASDPSGFPLPMGGMAYSTPISKALDKAAADDTVKAVVLRVDSPGGSAVASEIILNATKRVAAKKPFVVSMGNVAGSGGYYVACGTKTIFADASTITGSIGVVSGKFATTEAWKKIGINWTPIQRGANAGILASGATFTDPQRALLQGWMDEIYEVFKGHVQAIRGDKLKKKIDDLAGGRVFTGKQALELGLVDKIGGLDDAIKFAAKRAEIEEYDIRVFPRPKNFIETLLSDLQDGDGDSKSLSLALRHLGVERGSIVEAALPHLKGLESRRLRTVMTALQQLQLLQKEHVLTTMQLIDIRD